MNNRAYFGELISIIGSLPEEKRQGFTTNFLDSAKNPVVGFGLSAFLGTLGVDRFYAEQTLLGLLKLFTLGGFGVWTIIDYFMIAGIIRDKNILTARTLKQSTI